MKTRIATIAAVLLGGLTAGPATAADQEEIDTLAGLPGVYVTVQDLNPAAELATDKIRGDIELKLRRQGIQVFSVKQMRATPGLPIFKVVINVHKVDNGLYVYAVDLALDQTLQLVRRPSIKAFAPTWKSGSLGAVSADQLPHIKDLILQGTDEFTADYAQANPRHGT